MKLSICRKCHEIKRNYFSLHAVKINKLHHPNVFNFNKNLKVPLFKDDDIFVSIYDFVCSGDYFIHRHEFEYLEGKYIEDPHSCYWEENS